MREEPFRRLDAELQVRTLPRPRPALERPRVLAQHERPSRRVQPAAEGVIATCRLTGKADRIEAPECGRGGGAQRGHHLEERPLRVRAASVTRAEGAQQGGIALVVAHVPQDLVDDLLDHPLPVLLGEDLEAKIDAQVEGMAPEDARAHGMDGADPCRVDGEGLVGKAALAQARAYLLLDLLGCSAGEGYDEDLVEALEKRRPLCARTGREGPCHTLGERGRLSRARTRRHEERAVERMDDLRLSRSESACHYPRLLSQSTTGHQLHALSSVGSASMSPSSMRWIADATFSSVTSRSSSKVAWP